MLHRDRQFTFNNKQSFENQHYRGPAANHNNSQQYAFREEDSMVNTKNSFS